MLFNDEPQNAYFSINFNSEFSENSTFLRLKQFLKEKAEITLINGGIVAFLMFRRAKEEHQKHHCLSLIFQR